MSPLSHWWQTPVRHDQLAGTSHASASSSKLEYDALQQTERPDRANETLGPSPDIPAGGCGGLDDASTTPGSWDFPGPKISVYARLGGTPQSEIPAISFCMNAGGPQI